MFYTDAGRVVYAQGGITPDVIVKSDRDSKLLQQLLARYAFFNFAVDWLARNPKVAEDFTVTPEIRDEFFQFVEKSAKYSTADELKKSYDERPQPQPRRPRDPDRDRQRPLRPRGRPPRLRLRRPPDPEGPDALRRGRPDRVPAEEEARDGASRRGLVGRQVCGATRPLRSQRQLDLAA